MVFGEGSIPSYLVFAVVAFFINPVTGILGIGSAVLSKRKNESGQRQWARFFSDVAYGSSFTGILLTILLIVLLYAYRQFPESAYYDKQALIDG